MTEAGLKNAYKNSPELLEEMMEVKTIEELGSLFDDENFVPKGAGKTKRFYEAITGKSLENSSAEETNAGDEKSQETPQQNSSVAENENKRYVTSYPILCNGEKIEANSEVTAEELGDDLDRLLKIGAVLELLD
ncbi:MAG: hypothetical protein ACRCTJ_02295 [Brevinema sp.]